MAALLIGAFAASVAGTGLLRRYALARGVLDVPNDRSSHTVPTPRGGGVAIVVTFCAGAVALAALGLAPARVVVALLGAGGIVAVVGFLDDHRPISARWRLAAHFAAAAWALAWLGGLPPVQAFGYTVTPSLFGHALAAIGLVWLLNLYNFMDGIDGIAGVEASTVSVGAVLLHATLQNGEWALPALLGAASLGFLVWNFPPARIFMGDAGSGFLGLVLGILALRSATVSAPLLWSWMILLGVFVVDATYTLVRRLVRGEQVYQAHRSHAYQHAAMELGGHRPVTLFVGAVNLLLLLPIALLVGTGRLDGVVGVGIAYLPLIALAARFDSGAAAPPQR